MYLTKANENGVLLAVMALLCSLLLSGAVTAAENEKPGKEAAQPAQTSTLDAAYQSVTRHKLRVNGNVRAYYSHRRVPECHGR